jgi:3',5'-nucleoside bisphosphate phosphatase
MVLRRRELALQEATLREPDLQPVEQHHRTRTQPLTRLRRQHVRAPEVLEDVEPALKIAITDHILMKRDLLARAGKMASLGYRHFSVTPDRFDDYLAEIAEEAVRARRLYDLLVIPGAEVTQNHIRSKKNSHIVALNIRKFISADQPADDILSEIRRQGGVSIVCHRHHRTTRRVEIGTCFLWNHRKRLADLVDAWEAGNRDDLFSVTSLKHYPYIASSDFHKSKHLYSWKTLLRCEKNWPSIAAAIRANVDVALTLYRARPSAD